MKLKELAILLLLSCKNYWKVLDALSDTNYIQLTYLFMKYLVEKDLISLGEQFPVNLKREVENEDDENENENEDSFLNSISTNLDSINQKTIAAKIVNNYLSLKNSF